jgi:tryptophanyl-tRNA synthetase
MDKSESKNPNNTIFLLDEPDVIMSKLRKAMTDSEAVVKYSPEKPGVSNLLTIYTCLTGKSIPEAEAEFNGKNYGFFKNAVGEVVAGALSPIQDEYRRLMNDKKTLDEMLRPGAERAGAKAALTMKKVSEAIGFI